MALKLSKQTQFGPMAEQAYARITNFHGTKDSVQVQVAIYYDEESRHANRSQIADGAHYINLADLPKGMDFIPAIYEVLKTMADYKDAVDA
jgi:hypothetical protein